MSFPIDWVQLTAGCVLSIADVSIEPTETGWIESSQIDVLAVGSCPYVDISLPPQVTLDELDAKVRLSDGGRHKLDAARQRRTVRDVAGQGSLRLYTPEMLTGDKVTIEMQRTMPAADYSWAPGAGAFETRFVSLRSSALPASIPDDAQDVVKADGKGWWVENPPADLVVTLAHPHPGPSAAEYSELTDADEPIRAGLSLTLNVNGRDPMVALYPGGGSTADSVWTVSWPESSYGTDQAWVLPVPLDAENLSIEGRTSVGMTASLFTAPTVPTPVGASWSTPDAPVYGEAIQLPHAIVAQDVKMDDARIRWQEGADGAPGGWVLWR